MVRPIFICNGEQFDFDDDQSRIRNLFHDLIFIETKDKKINVDRNIGLAVVVSVLSAGEFLFSFYKIENQAAIELNLGFKLQL